MNKLNTDNPARSFGGAANVGGRPDSHPAPRRNGLRAWSLALLVLAVALPAPASDDQLIFTDFTNTLYGATIFNNGWKDKGRGVRFPTNSPVHSGTLAYAMTPTAANQSIYFFHDDIDTSLYTNLTFWISGGASGGQNVAVNGTLNGVDQPKVGIGKLPTNAWMQVTLSMAALGCANKTNLDGFRIWSNTNFIQPQFFVDDVVLVAAPKPALVQVGVHAAQAVRTVDARIFSVNATAWDPNIDAACTYTALNDMDNQALRWPGGSWGDQYHWTNEAWMDGATTARGWGSFSSDFINLATNTHAQVFIICNYGSSTPEEAAYGVRMFNVTNRCAFKYWEVGNENYGNWETDNNTNAPWQPHDPWTYAMRFTNYYAQMKAADPTIKIGAVGTATEAASDNYTNHFAVNPRTGVTNYGWTPVMLATLKSLGVTPDFLVTHQYGPDSGDTGALLWSKFWRQTAADIRQMLTDYLGPAGAGVEINATENGGSGKERQRNSLVSALIYADSIGEVLQTEINSRLWWDLRNGRGPDSVIRPSDPAYYGWRRDWFANPDSPTNTLDFYNDGGLIYNQAEPTNCYPTFYAAKLLKYFARGGDTVVQADSDYPLLATYAVRRTNGTLTLLVLNKSASSNLTAAFNVTGYLPATNALVYSYGIPQDDAARTGIGSPDVVQTNFNRAGAVFTNTFAPYSLTVMALVGSPQNLTWTGAGNNRWDVNSTTNWTALGQAETYSDGDTVFFDDTALTNRINLTSALNPAATLVNTSNTYTFGGSGALAGGSLTKTGPGTLIVSNNNTFAGGTLIQDGTLKLGHNSALNNAGAPVVVTNTGTLDFNATNSTLGGPACIISGPGCNGLGTLVNNLTNAQANANTVSFGPGSIMLAGSATLGGTNRWDLRSGANTFSTPTNAYTLTKVGPGIIGFGGTTVSSNLGDIYIRNGILSYEGATTGLGNPTNTIFVANGAQLRFSSATVPLNKNIVCSNGATLGGNGGNSATLNVVTGPVRLDGGTTTLFYNYYNAGIFSNAISGAGGLLVQWQSIVKLAGTNTYTGDTTVSRCNGSIDGLGTRLYLIGNGTIASSPRITLQGMQTNQAYAGFLDVLGRSDGTLTLAAGQTLQGDNGSFVRGTVVVGAGATLQPGGISPNYQFMSVSNVLTFQAGSSNHMDIYKTATLRTNDVVVVSGQVTYGGTLVIQTNGLAALVVGDTFKLFRAGSSAGNFASIADASGTTWSFNPATGTATVTALPPPVSTNADLTALVLTPAGTLAPTFAANVLSYAATAPYGSTPTVTAVNADLTATNRLIYNGATNLLASGVASAALPLAPSLAVTNVVRVQVTAQDGVTVKTYTVNVKQLPSQTKPQPAISLNNGGVTVAWPLDHLGYRLQVQTNQLNGGLTTNWFTWPGSTNLNSLALPLDDVNRGMFFRLVYP